MKTTGIIKDIARDMNDKFLITFALDEYPNEIVLDETKMSIEWKPFKKGRSKDANALLWHCIGQMAASVNADKWDIYLMLLRRYGKFSQIWVKKSALNALKAQWREIEVVGESEFGEEVFASVLCYYGSHTYTTGEFSSLLEGTISEMKEMGLEPPMPQEMKRSLEEWEKLHR